MASDERSDAALVAAVRDGERDAYGVLFERWFDRVYDVARNIVRNPETAADVAQDTFISAWERLDRLENVDAFGGWLLRSARNRALDRLEREGRSRPQADDVVTGLHDRGAPDLVGSRRSLDPEEISASLDRDGLVGAAAVALGERDASILDLHLRHGLSAAEIATELGVTPNNAHQLLFRMRKKLGDAVGAYVLWHRGRPVCAALRNDVAATFDADTLATVERHRRQCAECTERRSALVAPEQLFSAAPMLVAPLLLRSAVSDALRSAGVPVGTPPPSNGGIDVGSGESSNSADAGDGSGEPDSTDPDTQFGIGNGSAAETATEPHRNRRSGLLVLCGAAAIVLLAAAGVVIALDDPEPDASPSLPPAATSASSIPPASTTTMVQARSGTVPVNDGLAPNPSAPQPTSQAPNPQPPVAPPAPVPPTTAAPVTAPPSPSPIPPSPTPPSPTQPSPTPPSPTPPPPQPPTAGTPTTPPPAVVRLFFGTAPAGLLCPGTGTPRRIGWTSTDATSATLAVGSNSRSVAVVGQLDTCATSGDLVTLTVSGPGGSANDSIVTP